MKIKAIKVLILASFVSFSCMFGMDNMNNNTNFDYEDNKNINNNIVNDCRLKDDDFDYDIGSNGFNIDSENESYLDDVFLPINQNVSQDYSNNGLGFDQQEISNIEQNNLVCSNNGFKDQNINNINFTQNVSQEIQNINNENNNISNNINNNNFVNLGENRNPDGLDLNNSVDKGFVVLATIAKKGMTAPRFYKKQGYVSFDDKSENFNGWICKKCNPEKSFRCKLGNINSHFLVSHRMKVVYVKNKNLKELKMVEFNDDLSEKEILNKIKEIFSNGNNSGKAGLDLDNSIDKESVRFVIATIDKRGMTVPKFYKKQGYVGFNGERGNFNGWTCKKCNPEKNFTSRLDNINQHFVFIHGIKVIFAENKNSKCFKMIWLNNYVDEESGEFLIDNAFEKGMTVPKFYKKQGYVRFNDESLTNKGWICKKCNPDKLFDTSWEDINQHFLDNHGIRAVKNENFFRMIGFNSDLYKKENLKEIKGNNSNNLSENFEKNEKEDGNPVKRRKLEDGKPENKFEKPEKK